VPALLEQRNQEVERHNDVLSELLVFHIGGSDGDVHAGNLLELPLDGCLDIVDLLLDGLVVRHWLWESVDSVQDWTKHNWNLLNEVVSGEQEIVLLGPALDKLFVLVELLQGIQCGHINVKTGSLNLILMLLIGNQADLEVWSWNVWDTHTTSETLVFLWVVVLESNLELNGLLELSLLL